MTLLDDTAVLNEVPFRRVILPFLLILEEIRELMDMNAVIAGTPVHPCDLAGIAAGGVTDFQEITVQYSPFRNRLEHPKLEGLFRLFSVAVPAKGRSALRFDFMTVMALALTV
jgi:hypothetical protein